MSEHFVGPSQDVMSDAQINHLNNSSVEAFRRLAAVAVTLSEVGAELIQATVSIQIPGIQTPKLVNLASPNILPEALKELLELLGSSAEFGVNQSQIVIQMATYQARKEQAAKCAQCPDREDCDERTENEIVH